MKAANSASIKIDGAVLLRLEGQNSEGKKYSTSVMTYTSPDVKSFYLSKEALMQLGVKVKTELLRDVELGVLKRVSHGEPTKWCFCMVILRK